MKTVGGGDPDHIRIYTFEVGGRVLSVLFLYKESHEKEARAAFKMIADSLKKE